MKGSVLMKRSISLLLACLMVLLLFVPASAAAESGEEDPCVNGEHDIVIDKGTEPTCTKPGWTEGSHCSVCGKVFAAREKISEKGHIFVTDEAVAPTCIKKGKTEGVHCSVCGLVTVRQKDIAALGHDTVIDEAVEATCTSTGLTKGSHCSRCDDNTVEQIVIPKKNHVYEETIVKKTCIDDGYTLYVCKNCNDGYMSDFDYALGHQIAYDGEFIPQTCTKDGFQPAAYCSVCKEVIEESEVFKATGHKWKTQTTCATRTKDGRILTACSVCGETAPGGDVKVAKIASIKLSKNKFTYDGKAKKPAVVVTDSSGKVLTVNKDYTLSYDSGRKKVGAYYVSVDFKGNYSGRKVLKFRIVLAKPAAIKVSAGYKSASVSWDKVKGAKKYAVYYSTSKKGEYKKAGTTAKLKYDIAGLQSAKTYYIKVRAVTKSISGANSYGYYSSPIKVNVA